MSSESIWNRDVSGVLFPFIAIGFLAFYGYLVQNELKLTATTDAVLGRKFTETQHRRLGIHYRTTYQVTYRFQVGNRFYEGRDSISRQPANLPQVVYYNPNDPTSNQLNLVSRSVVFILFSVVCVISLMFYAKRLISRLANFG